MERPAIDSSTALFGVFGNPVAHSMGPVMHTRAFCEARINAVYLAFEIKDIKKGVEAVRELGIQGVSVTIPFKEDIMGHLDHVDPLALRMGAVNTVVNKEGVLTGFNTDWAGAVLPLKQAFSSEEEQACPGNVHGPGDAHGGYFETESPFTLNHPLAGRKACIIGAGGAARAVAFGLKEEGVHLTIANRSRSRGLDLAKEVGADFISLSDTGGWEGDIWINATSVGMTPGKENTPLAKKCFRPGQIVMDIIYNPVITRFLKEAEEKGCRTINGLAMFVNQGAAQFTLFTGMPAPVDVMEAALMEEMKNS